MRDTALDYKKWPHPADIPTIKEANLNEKYSIEAYTDGSKTEQGVGSGVAIYRNNELTRQLQYKLNKHCSNNQAEQLAILKSLEAIDNMEPPQVNEKTAAIFTDSKITLQSLHNTRNHNHLIEAIREKLGKLDKKEWKIEIGWVKAHIGIQGNEVADKLAKQATTQDRTESLNRLPKSTIKKKLREETLRKWEREWQITAK